MAGLFTTAPSSADTPKKTYHLKHINSERGLPSNRVPSIYFDNHGYLWTATYDGVGRYNGQSFEAFSRIPGEKNTLKTNQVNAIYVENSDAWLTNEKPTYKAWVGLNNNRGIQFIENGVVSGSLLEGRSININGIIDDGLSEIVVLSDSQVHLIKKYSDNHRKFEFDNYVTSAAHFVDTYVIGTLSGIRFTGNETKGLEKLSEIPIRSLGSRGRQLFVGTEVGLFQFSFDSKKIVKSFANYRVRSLNISNRSTLIGTYDGVFECDAAEIVETECDHILPGKIVTNILTDEKTGLSWVSTANDGVYQLNHLRKSYDNFKGKSGVQYHSYIVEESGTEWIASDGDGVWKRDKNIWTHFNKKELGSDRALTMIGDDLGKIWVGHYDGVSIIDSDTGSVQRLLEGKIILTLQEDNGYIYIGTDRDGVFKYSLEGTLLETINGKYGLTNQTITSLSPSKDNGLWIGTSEGLFHKSNSGPLANILTDEVIWSIYDTGNQVLIGTEGDGLLILENNKVVMTLTSKNSDLTSNTISDIGYYKNDNGTPTFVITTLNSIAVSKGAIGQNFTILSQRDGLVSSEYLRNGLSILRPNEFVAGGANGWSVIKGIVNSGPTSLSSFPIYLTKEIKREVPFGEPIFLDLLGVNHLSIHPLSYVYKLTDRNSVELNGQNSTVIDQLPPGNYKLRITTTSSLFGGIRELSFTVLPKSKVNLNLILIVSLISIVLIPGAYVINRQRMDLKYLKVIYSKLVTEHGKLQNAKIVNFEPSFAIREIVSPDLPEAVDDIGFIDLMRSQLELSEYAELFTFEPKESEDAFPLTYDHEKLVWWLFAKSINHSFEENSEPEKINVRITSAKPIFEMQISIVGLNEAVLERLASELGSLNYNGIDLEFMLTTDGANFRAEIKRERS